MNRDEKAITIYDIAKEAGVSPATVSRVLSNTVNVREEKRKRVMEIVEKYHFQPNALAKGLSATKSKIIGILSADIRNPYYAEVFVACEKAAFEAGYRVMLCNSLSDRKRGLEQLELMAQQKVDAIIGFGGMVDDVVSDSRYVEKVNLLLKRIPFVITGRLQGANCYEVRIDSGKASELVMEHLLALGHRKIGLIGGRRDVVSTREKFDKYCALLEREQIPYREDYIVDGKYDYETGYEGMKKLLEGGDPPTAVVAINDYAMAGITTCIRDFGLCIPTDISVVSYDNTTLTEITSPKITGVDYNYDDFGRRLVQTAIAAIEKKPVEKKQWIVPQLVIKQSTAKVKADSMSEKLHN